jgi:hypothetical protein
MVVNSTSERVRNFRTYPDDPFAVDALWASTLHVRYETPDLTFATDVRARPGGRDA